MNETKTMNADIKLDTATFGAGCFWCVEAIFQQIDGVHSVVSGYSGGHVLNPSYSDVSNGTTGHAEVCRISYDPAWISYADLLEIFFFSHDPTTRDRQGADVGTQYRSVIFYHNEEQKKLAEKYARELDNAGIFDSPIVTEISPFTSFYEAEEYHQNYFNENRSSPYCLFLIDPKIEKLKKRFRNKLKSKSQ